MAFTTNKKKLKRKVNVSARKKYEEILLTVMSEQQMHDWLRTPNPKFHDKPPRFMDAEEILKYVQANKNSL
jgi:hypothetical protein